MENILVQEHWTETYKDHAIFFPSSCDKLTFWKYTGWMSVIYSKYFTPCFTKGPENTKSASNPRRLVQQPYV